MPTELDLLICGFACNYDGFISENDIEKRYRHQLKCIVKSEQERLLRKRKNDDA